MDSPKKWLAQNIEDCTALFEAVDLVVTTFDYHGRKTLKRHNDFDRLMIEKVEQGLRQTSWQGLLYVMHWSGAHEVCPLYIGKTERCGRKKEVSANIQNIRFNDGFFGRWGYSLAYHIGDLSHAMFGGPDERKSDAKYRTWADRLFTSHEPPQLRRKVSVALIDWFEGKRGPKGTPLSVKNAEKEIIELAKRLYPELLNLR